MKPSERQGWSGRLILAAGSMLDQPATVVLDAAASAGFDGVGLRLSGEHAVADPSTLGDETIERGLVLHDVEVYRIAPDAADPGPLVEASAAAGAEALLVVSDLPDRSATLSALVELRAQCDVHGLRLALEYMAWTNPAEPLDAIEIARMIGCDLVVDLLHHVRVGADVAELDAILDAGILGWVQLCDASLGNSNSGSHDALIHEARHQRLAPGHGELPLARLLGCLPDGATISVEVQSDDLLDTDPLERAHLLHQAARAVLKSM